MKSLKLLALTAIICANGCLLTANARAQETPTSGKTRAQVIQELKDAEAAGLVGRGDVDYPVMPEFVSTKTRSEVIEELKQARAQGLLNINDVDYPPTPAPSYTKTREEVKAELLEAQRHGDFNELYRGY